ncbi:NTP transferase domain-containing protein [Hespellia stercorisuis]|uniref:ModE molybdate transport repressor domain-containing protein n=1 Tax=Hespellia stercorisuis DSM 15480 TaxID=1121950 RepID=A0A1M6UE14_9FIRM|nr:NTP transferase domain-containing protein [Hespellia stercorisuis]SHK67492.1 ModE molybdate transport repressor domain-containing protein [Hespellia stercorisuis DSM 15480]
MNNNLRTGAVITATNTIQNQHQISPLTQLGSISVIRRIILIFQQADISPIVVITGRQALEIEQHLANYGVIFIRDENYEHTTPMEQAKLGLAFLAEKCSRLFFTSADIPVFLPGTLRSMKKETGEIIIPTFRKKDGFPVLLSQKTVSDMLAEQHCLTPQEYIARDLPGKKHLESNDKGIFLTADHYERLDPVIAGHNQQLLHPFVTINIERDQLFFNSRAKLLLQLVLETHSVQSACKYMAVSKSKAWDMINQMEAALGFPVVQRRHGGSHGGQTELTAKGRQFLDAYLAYEEKVKRYASEQFRKDFPDL